MSGSKLNHSRSTPGIEYSLYATKSGGKHTGVSSDKELVVNFCEIIFIAGLQREGEDDYFAQDESRQIQTTNKSFRVTGGI